MNSKALPILLILLLTSALAFADSASCVEGQMLVRFADKGYGLDSPYPATRAAARQQVLQAAGAGGGTVKHLYKHVSGLTLVELPCELTVEQAVTACNNTPGILYAAPNHKLKLFEIPNDTYFDDLWAMRNTGQTGGVVGADIDAVGAWDFEKGSSDIIVAVTDTGVDYTHPDLLANMWVNEAEQGGLPGVDDDGNGYVDDIYGYDFAGDSAENLGDADSDPFDVEGHGTHVSGIIGAVGNNNRGVVGVCWDVSIMALKIFADDGGSDDASAILAIEYAIDNGARVINASWGSIIPGQPISQPLYDAVNSARQAGVLFVAAAGNDLNNNDNLAVWPANFDLDNVISVLATGHSDLMATYSNYGVTTVDIAAPGGDFARGGEPGMIYSTIPGADYDYMQGTSMASPYVAGACALILSAQPSMSYSQVKELLMDSVDEMPQLAGQCASGGRLNLFNAIEQLVLDTESPKPDPAQWVSWGRPKATGVHTIAMQAKEATDNKGSVQYLFKCVNDDSFSSDWQSGNFYKAEGLAAATTYTFRVQARDDSNNMTNWSELASAKTAPGPSDPCSPFPDPTQWLVRPRRVSTTSTAVIMVARNASDESEPVEYEFQGYGAPGLHRDFEPDPAYFITSGLSFGNSYSFEVRARDMAGNTTAWSTQEVINLTVPPQEIEVPGNYPTIQDAINAAQNGDTIIIHPGTYPGKEFVINKNIVIRSTNPDNPDTVASTIIDCLGTTEMSRGFILYGDTFSLNPHCELKGLTITNVFLIGGNLTDGFNPGDNGTSAAGFGIYGGGIYIRGNHLVENCVVRDCTLISWDAGDGADGNDVEDPYYPLPGGNGGGGGDVGGVGIYVEDGSPVIRGTTIDNCYAYAGNGGDGGEGATANDDPDPNNPGGRGGNAGNAGTVYGAGVCVDHGATFATFEDCTITNCFAVGGSAGDGGLGGTNADLRVNIQRSLAAHEDPNGNGAGGHGGVPGPVLGAGFYSAGSALLKDCTIQRNFALGGYGGDGGDAGVTTPDRGYFNGGVGGLLDEWETNISYPQGILGPDAYTAKGGGVFVGDGASVTVENSSIEDNATRGSVSGRGGLQSILGAIPSRPRQNYQIESLGAGLFYDVVTSADIHGSEILRNRAINYPLNINFVEFPDGNDVFPGGLHPHPIRFEYYPIDQFGWGGGLYFDTSWFVEITNSEIADNNAPVGGGMAVIGVTNDFHLDNCRISNNIARYGGGAAWANSIIDANSCTIGGNVATTSTGGGIHCGNSSLSLRNSMVLENASETLGGGVYLIGVDSISGSQEIINCLIKDNQAGLDGGGIAARDNSFVSVRNCTIVNNSTLSATRGSGGGLSCVTVNSAASSFVEVTSSILWDNESAFGPQIAVGNPVVSDNPMATVWTRYSDVQGGEDAIFEGSSSDQWLGPWSYWGIGNLNEDPLFAHTDAGYPLSAYYLSNISAGQRYDSPCIDAGEGLASDLANDVDMTVTTRTDGVPDSETVDMGYHYPASDVSGTYMLIIEVLADAEYDPNGTLRAELFGDANLGESHNFKIEAREDINSIYVTRGAVVDLTAIPDTDFKVRQWQGADSDNSTELTNTVTMDSHKVVSVSFAPDGYYYLITNVSTENGRIDYRDESLDEPIPHPGRTLHKPGEVVELIAVPDNPSHVTRWFGSNDDLTIARQNIVTMNGHRNVNVSFTTPRTLHVGTDKEFPTIQLAIDDAESGDIVLITAGTYDIYEASQDESYLYLSGKDITITSDNPLDASNVIIIGGFVIEDVRRETVIEGLTIQAEYTGGKLIGGPYKVVDPEGSGVDGFRGDWGYGGGMWLVNGYMNQYAYTWPEGPKADVTASPTVRNCIFRDCIVRGVHGGNGAGGADGLGYGGNGGPGGAALGGGVCIGDNATPLFEDCAFIDCMAIGGDGGNAGDDPPGHGGAWGDKNGPWWWEYPVTDFWIYSGYGGAVYCGVNSSPEFINCSFTGNQSFGGSCGISGDPQIPGWPYSHYKIDRFGGAVYAADDSTPSFKNCVFTGNTADTNGPAIWNVGYTPDDAVSAYDTLSYGGAIAFGKNADLTFEDCTFTGNTSTVGGAIYYNFSDPYIKGCEIADNNALHGGGLLCVGGHGIIERCTFTGNMATINGAQGGAIASLGANTEIIDTQVIGNFSQTSGGGIYISNKDVEGGDLGVGWNMVLLHNCLIAENTAGLSGGGISANWHGFPEIENCTIVNNSTGSAGYGGGLYSSYGNYATINNSIIWGNSAGAGKQIALRPTERPSDVVISYSDIQGVLIAVRPPNIGGDIWADLGCNATVAPGAEGSNIGSNPVAHNPNFVTGPLGGNYYLSQIVAGQGKDSPCVDAGDKTASDVKIASELITMDNYTTRTDWTQKYDAFDKGKVDMGFHYPFKHLIDECRVCNLDFDGIIDSDDLYEFSLRWSWLGEHCSEQNNYCDGGDLNFDHKVDFGDFALLAGCWLNVDNEPPMPSPMEWQVRPYSTTDTEPFALGMKAVQAFDAWGWPTPQYFFECKNDPNWSSGWQNSREYAPTGLQPDTGYIFRVRARDDMSNMTRWSDEASAVTGEVQYIDDNTPPTPNPMTWLEVPFAISDTEIGMVASTATDESGVEYGFWNVTLDPGGTQVVWQDEPNFIDTGLTPSTAYAYRCAARDNSFNHNMTAWSDPPLAATTLPAGTEADTEPPITGVYADIYKAAFTQEATSNPREVYVSGPVPAKGYYHVMTAVTATDATGPVWYNFICVSNGSFSSGWQQAPTYTVLVASLSSKSYYIWQVVTRDSVVPVPNQGNYSDYHNCKGDVVPYP